ncbi:hypothetical protein [Streptomyces sp. HD]|uniref:hypothetical protein n=1 Tax=Streptomyces sp. HD TaxID=3020892 RepID=UPI00232BAB12|nr:hypothetical protein [Streptomyces sp. HD]MDC0770488.1 hypothetical protein [Streptomyces sp. HD]
MPRPPARTVIASTLSAAALLSASACSYGDLGQAARAVGAPDSPAATVGASSAPAAAPTLTEAQARAALISAEDLGEPWVPTKGFATWRDAMLKADTEKADCKRLLDALYAEELFGPDARTRASVGLDDEWDEAQLRYQIVAHRPEDLDRTLKWLAGLPEKCGEFTAIAGGGELTVKVSEAEMPEAGDARQGLRIVLGAVSEYDDAPMLTLHVAAVRVGDDAIAITNGGLGDVPADATSAAVELGTRRLAEARKRGRQDV